DSKRGDQVEVANLRLAETPQNPISEPAGFFSFLQFTKDDLMHAIEIAVMALLGLVVLMIGLRPIMRRILGPEPVAAIAAAVGASALLAGPGAVAGAGAITASGARPGATGVN